MALSSTFQERLDQMERTRNQRLSLLQAEKDLQANKYQIFSSKLANNRLIERRCLILDHKIAFQNFEISYLKSEIESLDTKYDVVSQKLRALNSEVEELEEMEREKERFYESKELEMKGFREKVERFVMESRMQVNQLKNQVNELKTTFRDLQGNNGILSNSEIGAAETRRLELVAMKEKMAQSLASNYRIKAELQRQVDNAMNMIAKGETQFIENNGLMK